MNKEELAVVLRVFAMYIIAYFVLHLPWYSFSHGKDSLQAYSGIIAAGVLIFIVAFLMWRLAGTIAINLLPHASSVAPSTALSVSDAWDVGVVLLGFYILMNEIPDGISFLTAVAESAVKHAQLNEGPYPGPYYVLTIARHVTTLALGIWLVVRSRKDPEGADMSKEVLTALVRLFAIYIIVYFVLSLPWESILNYRGDRFHFGISLTLAGVLTFIVALLLGFFARNIALHLLPGAPGSVSAASWSVSDVLGAGVVFVGLYQVIDTSLWLSYYGLDYLGLRSSLLYGIPHLALGMWLAFGSRSLVRMLTALHYRGTDFNGVPPCGHVSEEQLAVLVRLFTVYIVLNFALNPLFFNDKSNLIVEWILIFVVALLLWFFPKTIALKLRPRTSASAPTALSVSDALAIGAVLLGLSTLIKAIAGLVFLLVKYAQTPSNLAMLITEVVLGMWLVFGNRGLVRLLTKMHSRNLA